MAQGLNGSICFNDLIAGASIVNGPDGKPYLDLTSLPAELFKRSEKNGKTYVTIFVNMKDEPGQYGDIASVNLPKTQAQAAANQYGTTIAWLKYNQTQGGAQPQGQNNNAWGAPPATAPQPAANQWGAQPAAQPQYAPQPQTTQPGAWTQPQQPAGAPPAATQQPVANTGWSPTPGNNLPF